MTQDTLHGAITRYALGHPDRVAVVHGSRSVCYERLAELFERMAAWLHEQGVRPGAIAGIHVADELAHLVVTLALDRLDATQVVLSSHESPAAHRAIVHRIHLSHVIAAAPLLEPIGVPVVTLADRWEDARAADAPAAQGDPTRVAFIKIGSGTTGRAKLIPVTAGDFMASTLRHPDRGTVTGLLAGIEQNPSHRTALRALARGRAVVLASTFAGRPVIDVCREWGVDDLSASVYQARRMAAAARAGATHADTDDRPVLAGVTVRIGGSRVDLALARDVARWISEDIRVAYGTTEVGVLTRGTLADLLADPDSVGVPVPGVELQVVDSEGHVLPSGQVGQIRVRTQMVFRGYLDDEEATARALRDGWFHPGDVGCVSPGGAVSLRGRTDDMMSLNGINIFPSEIEAVAEVFPGVLECAAFASRSSFHGDIPMIAVVASPGQRIDTAELLRHCRARLGLRAPRKAVIMAALPRNDAGKVLRRELALHDPGEAA